MLVLESPNFLALPPGAASLFEQAAGESFFSSVAWYDLMARYGVGTGRHVRLYLDRDTSTQLAFVSQAGPKDDVEGARILRSLTNAYSCEHCVILGPNVDRAILLQDLAAWLCGESPGWHRIMLSGLDPVDPTVRAMAAALRHVGMAVKPFFDSGTWYEQTDGVSFSHYLAQRPSALRNTWRRKAAKLERASEVRFAYYDSAEHIEQGIADYETIYKKSWKPEESYPLFMPALIRMAAVQGALRMGILHFGGQPAAAQFWILWRGKACIYKLAHDQSLDEYSLGTILTMRMMERVLDEDRPLEVNFGRGDDPYKKLWLSKRRERWGLAAANPRTLRGFAHAVRQTAARIARPFRPGEPRPPI